MISFSQQVKKEICSIHLQAPCCVSAACYGIACFGRYFDTDGIVLHSERSYIAQWAKSMYAAAGISGKVFVRGKEKTNRYEFAVKDPFEIEKMLVMFGHTGDETAVRIRRENIVCENCAQAFISAAFLCAGTVVDPKKGYNLEFVSGRYQLMGDFSVLLEDAGFEPKRAVRKGSNIIYFRASEQIEDLLTMMGATKSSLEIMQLKVYKDFRNKANRITNCETANIDKIVAAASQIMSAIKTIESNNAFDSLPQPLKDAIKLRKENPDLSLAELAEISPEPVSKSGLSHRFKKICGIADNIADNTTGKDA